MSEKFMFYLIHFRRLNGTSWKPKLSVSLVTSYTIVNQWAMMMEEESVKDVMKFVG